MNSGSVTNFVPMVINSSNLVRIRYKILSGRSLLLWRLLLLVRKHWEQLRQIIKENDLKSAGDIYALLKDSFKDLLQELLEAKLDVSLGYDKNEKHGIETEYL